MSIQQIHKPDDVQKHHSNNSENFQTHINNPNFFSFVTHNVRSCMSPVKMQQIELFFTNHNLDILGLSETHFTTSKALYYSSNLQNKPYRFLFSSTNSKQNCQGVGFIIRNYLYDHIFFKKFIQDRIAYIDLQFKNKTKLRIIQVYLPANTSDREQIELRIELEKIIIDIIIEAQSKAFHVTLMGDFNFNYYTKNENTSKNRRHGSFFDKILNLICSLSDVLAGK